MTKGAAIKFVTYGETIPKLLTVLKLPRELKKFDKIILKPTLTNPVEDSTSPEFTETVLRFVLENKNPVAEVFIAEGADGHETEDLFAEQGYRKLAEKYSIGLIDLNNTETEDIEHPDFLKFSKIIFPKIILNSLVIPLTKLKENEETHFTGSLASLLGYFPASHYTGFFSQTKNKIRKWPIKYSIHDVALCHFPQFTLIDASEQGLILAGQPIEMDKQAAKILGHDWKSIPYIKLLEESFSDSELK